MAERFTRVCDLGTDDHPATLISEVHVGKTVMAIDVCDDHLTKLTSLLSEIGYKPTKARVGKENRGAYIAKSGRVFTTKDVRTWLEESGRDGIPVSGRLPQEFLEEFAEAH